MVGRKAQTKTTTRGPRKYIKYTLKNRLELLELLKTGLSITRAAEQLGFKLTTARLVRDMWHKQGRIFISKKERQRLRKQEKTRQERDKKWIKLKSKAKKRSTRLSSPQPVPESTVSEVKKEEEALSQPILKVEGGADPNEHADCPEYPSVAYHPAYPPYYYVVVCPEAMMSWYPQAPYSETSAKIQDSE